MAALDKLLRLYRDKYQNVNVQKGTVTFFCSLYRDTDFGRKCLTARWLVECGVRFVEILDGAHGRRQAGDHPRRDRRARHAPRQGPRLPSRSPRHDTLPVGPGSRTEVVPHFWTRG